MPTEAEMKAVLQRYVDGFNAADPEAVLGLFADDAVVEDPYGTPPMQGRAAFAKFFTDAVGSGTRLTLDGPIRGSHGDRAAMAFTVELPGLTIRVIDVMRFDEAGKVIHMQAYWGPEDIAR